MIVETADRLKTVEEYYFSRKLKEIARLTSQGVSIINLGIGKPDLIPATPIVEQLNESSTRANAHGYQSYRGIPDLRESIAVYYRKHFDAIADPETDILPLIGSKEGIMHISMTFLNPGDEVLIPDPGYPSYSSATKLAGGIVKTYDLTDDNNYEISIDQLDKLKTNRTKLLWINYPHMPTGTRASKKLLENLVAWAKTNKVLLCSDSPYQFILSEKPSSVLSISGAKDVCIELNSLSKSHAMSGWRVGMAISNAEVINSILRFKSNMDSGMFRPIQEAAIKAMQMDDSWYKSNNEIYAKRRATIWTLLDDLNFKYRKDVSGLFVWSKVSERFEDGEAASDYFLQKARVFIPPGMIFGDNGKNHVRWSLCQPLDVIKDACARIKSVV